MKFKAPSSTNPQSTIDRESYVTMMLAIMYTFHKGLIDRQSATTQLIDLVRQYTDHNNWRIESPTEHTKFAVSYATYPAYYYMIAKAEEKSKSKSKSKTNKEDIEVEHAVPVETIVAEMLSTFNSIESVNPYLYDDDLKLKKTLLSIFLNDHTLLVYVTKEEHKKLKPMPPNWKISSAAKFDYRLLRYHIAGFNLRPIRGQIYNKAPLPPEPHEENP